MAGHDRLTAAGKQFYKQLQELAQLQVRVGYEAGEETTEDGVDLAEVALYNEVGTKTSPPRPFLRTTADKHEAEMRDLGAKVVSEMAQGRRNPVQSLEVMGKVMRGKIKDTIMNEVFEPNSPATIAKKGFDFPLVDTMKMHDKASFKIRPKGEE